jgi:hypothetical protein
MQARGQDYVSCRRRCIVSPGGELAARWLMTVAVCVIAWGETPLCNGGRSVEVACTAMPTRASLESRRTSHASGDAAAFAANYAPSTRGRAGAVARRTRKLQTPPAPVWAMPQDALQQCALPQRRGTTTGLQISLTISGDDDEEVKKDYRRADADGSRIFISGLAPSVDEKRLILALQSFEGVVEVSLAKPGLGFALFMDPASADVAIESLQGAKLGGKVLTVRRARSFYIQQQQQATMRTAIDRRMREQGVVPARADLQRRTENLSPTDRSPSSLDMRRASLSSPPLPATRPAGAGAAGARRGLRKELKEDLKEEEEDSEAVFEKEDMIRKQAMVFVCVCNVCVCVYNLRVCV